jgi:type IV pilus assembly protein PilP
VATGGPRPDPNRRREPLEEYPLDSLKMVGTLTRANQSWAVVQAPDGAVHRAKIGDHMGQNFGRVKKITDNRVDLVELIQNPLGEWIEREANLALAE